MKALEHEYPRWEGDERDPSSGDAVYVWPGKPRFVSAKRARKLRKRGVPLMPCHRVHDCGGGEHRPGEFYPTSGQRARYCWFETEAGYEARTARCRPWVRLYNIYGGKLHENLVQHWLDGTPIRTTHFDDVLGVVTAEPVTFAGVDGTIFTAPTFTNAPAATRTPEQIWDDMRRYVKW